MVQSVSTLIQAAGCERTAHLAEETMLHCLHELRELQERARNRLALARLWCSFCDAWVLLAPDGVILDANAGTAAACSRAVEDLVGQHVREALPEDRLTSRLALFHTVLETGQPLAVRSNERGRQVEVYLQPMARGHGRQPWAVMVMVRYLSDGADALLGRTWHIAGDAVPQEPMGGRT